MDNLDTKSNKFLLLSLAYQIAYYEKFGEPLVTTSPIVNPA